MARITPHVHQNYLELSITHGARTTLEIGSQSWYEWLETNRAFRFEDIEGKFTARREQRPGGWYWYAYRRIEGVLHISYLGKSCELTLDRLHTVAHQLANPATSRYF